MSYYCLDLELSDFITSSPCLTTRTPGQLLSLTSHLTFGSGEPKSRNRSTIDYTAASYNLMNAINRQSKFFENFSDFNPYKYLCKTYVKSNTVFILMFIFFYLTYPFGVII